MSPALAEAAARATNPDLPDRSTIHKGTGVIVKGQEPGGRLPPALPQSQVTGSGVVLNFEGADLREVVRNILGDILNESYTIDPAVGGQVTIRTSAGIPRETLVATLETLLRMNGATLVKEAGIYKVLPQAAGLRGEDQRTARVVDDPTRGVGVREAELEREVRVSEAEGLDARCAAPDRQGLRDAERALDQEEQLRARFARSSPLEALERLDDAGDLLHPLGLRHHDGTPAALDHGLEVGVALGRTGSIDPHRRFRDAKAARTECGRDVTAGFRLPRRRHRILEVKDDGVRARASGVRLPERRAASV